MLALRAGADPAARDADGNTALAIVARPGLRDATRLLHAYAGPQ
jgi:ankyrin repeat protein